MNLKITRIRPKPQWNLTQGLLENFHIPMHAENRVLVKAILKPPILNELDLTPKKSINGVSRKSVLRDC